MLLQHQEKRGDIVASLRLLIEGVKVVMGPSQLGCVASLLQRMENNINNYLLILTHLQLNVSGGHSDKHAHEQYSQEALISVICWSKEMHVSGCLGYI